MEEGVLTVRAGGPVAVHHSGGIGGPATPGAAAEFRLGAGDALAVPTGTAIELRNDGETPAAALVAGVFASGGNWGWTGPDTNPWQPLGLGMPDAVSGPATAMLERVTIGPGATAAGAVPGPEVIVVEAGALTLGVEQGQADTYPAAYMRSHAAGPGQERVDDGSTARLASGDAVLVHAGARRTLRNAGGEPLVLLILTIVPRGAVTGTPVP